MGVIAPERQIVCAFVPTAEVSEIVLLGVGKLAHATTAFTVAGEVRNGV